MVDKIDKNEELHFFKTKLSSDYNKKLKKIKYFMSRPLPRSTDDVFNKSNIFEDIKSSDYEEILDYYHLSKNKISFDVMNINKTVAKEVDSINSNEL